MHGNWPQLLVQAASDMGINLTEEQVLLFCHYCREITAWNKKINLLSRSSSGDTLLKNFIDSLTPLPFLPHKKSTILDMGSGGGFPGIPLKIACDTLKVSLLESARKKTSFLKHLIRTLQLPEITVIHGRAENLQTNEAYRNTFDVVISKAAFKLQEFLPLGACCLSPSSILIAMKGENVRNEVDAARPAAAASG
ncbi:MAG: 16S rRNA (guanine(527)-N(7))-methyltransferase RsmG, partial [Syntrophales bacterium]|nr:16S rRNA (guanine(527)-N(7))-methyltransferase RsmG [Syntrophales bacterium]